MPKKPIEKEVNTETKSVTNVMRHEGDTGSPEAQIAYLDDEIKVLQSHLMAHKKDVDAKRSLLKKVARRRKLAKYLKDTNLPRYMEVAKKLGFKDAA